VARSVPDLHSSAQTGKYGVSSKIAAASLKQLVKLSERKETLLAELQNIDRRMIALEQEFRETRRRKNLKGKVTFSRASRKSGKARPAGRRRR